MWKALKNDVFGHNVGEIFDAPLHAVQVHLEKGEIEECGDVPKFESIILEETSASKEPLANAEEVGKAYEKKLNDPLVEAPKKRMGRPKGWKPGQKYTPQS